MKKQSGFTLIELAIVLVIIGLLLGGVLKGQELIMQARIKNLRGDFDGLSAGIYGYQDRYNALPGDDRNALGRWPASVSGNGDSIIAGTYNVVPAAGAALAGLPESNLFWDHMRRAGFVTGTGGEPPLNSAGGRLGVQTGDGVPAAGGGANGPVLGTAAAAGVAAVPGFTGVIICSANIPDKAAIAIDAQMDDGIPNTGLVRAALQNVPNPAVPVAADAGYAETGSNQYIMCKRI